MHEEKFVGIDDGGFVSDGIVDGFVDGIVDGSGGGIGLPFFFEAVGIGT